MNSTQAYGVTLYFLMQKPTEEELWQFEAEGGYDLTAPEPSGNHHPLGSPK